MSSLSLNLLGSFKVSLDGEPIPDLRSSRVRALIIYLAVERSSVHRREHLFTLLWPGMPEKSARHNLSQTLYSLRQTFPDVPGLEKEEPVHLLLADRQTVQINPAAAVQIDIHQLDRLLEGVQIHDHLNLAGCLSCIQSLEQAAALYKGDFLADFYLEDSNHFEDWAQANREAFRRKILECIGRLTEISIQKADYEEARTYAQGQLDIDPLRESTYRQLMEILARSGRRAEALRQYRACLQVFKQELGVDPSRETKDLFERIQTEDLTLTRDIQTLEQNRDEMAEPPEEASATKNILADIPQGPGSVQPSQVSHNLTSQPTAFIGRKKEIAALEHYLGDPKIRLVTLVGPGGIGKTRLALEIAERQIERRISNGEHIFRDGVFLVDLTPLSEGDQLVLSIAEAINIQFTGGAGPENSPKQQLLGYLSDKYMFFIIDNFEQFLVGVELVSEILQAGPGIRIFATSRERLQLRQEQLYPVPALDFRDWKSLEEAEAFTAVKILLQAAQRIRPDFKITVDHLGDLTRICRLVGGMPLALELAAGWVELLSLAEIATEIENRLGFLESEFQDLPHRHRSMQAIFESTWSQLERDEKAMMEQLSVFRGGFTRDAARQVIAGQLRAGATLKLLGRLSSKSLIQADPAQARYQVHELLRQYALERLGQSGEMSITRTAHASYYLDMLGFIEGDIKGGPRQKQALEEIEADYANIGTAWTCALEQDNLEAINQALESLFWFFKIRDRQTEGVELFMQAEVHLVSTPDRASNPIWRRIAGRRIYLDYFAWIGSFEENIKEIEVILIAEQQDRNLAEIALTLECRARFQGQEDQEDIKRSLPIFEEVRSIYHQIGDQFSEYQLIGSLSWSYLIIGELEKRIELIRQQLKMAQKKGDRLTASDAQGVLGQIAERAGCYSEALATYQEVLPVFQEFGDRAHTIEYHIRLGELAFLEGDIHLTRRWIAEAQALAKQSPKRTFQLTLTLINGTLGMILNMDERYRQARQLFQDNLFLRNIVISFFPARNLSYTMCGLGDFSAAREYIRTALVSVIFLKAPGWQVQCLPAAALITANEDQLERAAELLALAYHHPAGATGWLEAFPLVVRLRSRLEKELPQQVYEAAWNRGQTLDLEETVSSLLIENKEINHASI